MIVSFEENTSGDPCKASEDIPGTRMLFSAVISRSELTDRFQQINVICPDEVLSHANDSLREGHLPVMVR